MPWILGSSPKRLSVQWLRSGGDASATQAAGGGAGRAINSAELAPPQTASGLAPQAYVLHRGSGTSKIFFTDVGYDRDKPIGMAARIRMRISTPMVISDALHAFAEVPLACELAGDAPHSQAR